VQELIEGERGQLPRGQFQRERDPLEPTAELLRLTASTRSLAQQIPHGTGAVVGELLEPGQDEQEVTLGEMAGQDATRRSAGLVGGPERFDQGVGHQIGIAERREFGKPDSVLVSISHGCHAMRHQP
jgi:hypothetical protein